MKKIFKLRSPALFKSLVLIFVFTVLLIGAIEATQSQTLNDTFINQQNELLTQRLNNTTQPKNSTNELSFMRADHVEIRVPNFEETVKWYKEKLGFREQVNWTVKALPGLQIAYLELNGFRLEVIEGNFTSNRQVPSNFQEVLNVEGYGHICFEVGNIDAVLAELKKRGVSTLIPAETYPLVNAWRRVGFVLDNNGNAIEFGEPLTMTKPQRA